MKNDITLLYKHLMGQLQHNTEGWYNDYKTIISKVAKLRDVLVNYPELTLNDSALYDYSDFADKEDLIRHSFFANKPNGVASNGRSVFSEKNYRSVKDNLDFLSALRSLIIDPNKANHIAFANTWSDVLKQNNPVHTNRATATCTLDVSTTVNTSSFDEVFKWLSKQKYIPEYNGDGGWYDKNVWLMSYIREELSKVQDEEFPKYDDYWSSVFVWLVFENLSNPFSLKKQVVKYGAPGTGKTYKAKETAKLQYETWKNAFGKNSDLAFNDSCIFIQFHPSYSYEDFMEGLRPLPDEKGDIQLRLANGVFKQHCIKAGKWECDLHELGFNKHAEINKLRIGDLPKEKLQEKHWKSIFSLPDESKLMEVLPPFFVLIDEINRAELSRVFGELMYCLEYRGLQGIIKTQYAELNTARNGMLKVGDGYQFFIPSNLYIIGSMNTVDRSVDSFDFALRRRFRWEEVQPDISLLRYHLKSNYPKWVQLADGLKKLNDLIEIEPILGKDYRIGHSYLWNLDYSPETSITEIKKLIWADSVGALIEEYLRGSGKEHNYEKFQKAFTG
jgi:5-methylcytosine-specific restriction protein B